MRRLCFWMFGAVQLCANQAHAQDYSLHLRRGASVRIWDAALGYTKSPGVIAARRGDSLEVRMRFRGVAGGDMRTEAVYLSLQKLDRIEVRVKRGRSLGAAVARGCLIVGGPLAAITAVAVRENGNEGAIAVATTGLLGCVPGAIIGGVKGSGPPPIWVAVPKSQVQTIAAGEAPSAPAPVSTAVPTIAVTPPVAVVAPTTDGRRVVPNDLRLQPGRRVRIWSQSLSASPAIGEIVSNTGDSLTLTVAFTGNQGLQEYRTVGAAASQVDSLDVETRTRRKGNVQGSAMIGLFAGALLGAALSSCGSGGQQGFEICGPGVGAIGGGLVGFVVGAVVGMLAGYGDNVDWVAIPMAPR